MVCLSNLMFHNPKFLMFCSLFEYNFNIHFKHNGQLGLKLSLKQVSIICRASFILATGWSYLTQFLLFFLFILILLKHNAFASDNPLKVSGFDSLWDSERNNGNHLLLLLSVLDFTKEYGEFDRGKYAIATIHKYYIIQSAYKIRKNQSKSSITAYR